MRLKENKRMLSTQPTLGTYQDDHAGKSSECCGICSPEKIASRDKEEKGLTGSHCLSESFPPFL